MSLVPSGGEEGVRLSKMKAQSAADMPEKGTALPTSVSVAGKDVRAFLEFESCRK